MNLGTSPRMRKMTSHHWKIGSTLLPIVQKYRYLDQDLQNNGRWDAWLKKVLIKTKQRTTELVRWGRSNHITIDILSRLWVIYVEIGAGWGMASTNLQSGPKS